MKVQGEDIPVLIAQTGKLQGRRWPLDTDDFLIGRGQDCAVVVPDRQVSRHHAIVSKRQTRYCIEDLGSKNGTSLNGVRIYEHAFLQDGDVIQIALALELVFFGTEATIPLSNYVTMEIDKGRLQMAPEAHSVLVQGVEIEPPLSPPQYRLLELLFNSSGKVVKRVEIADVVWPGTKGIGVSDQAIDALVRRLRDRLRVVDSTQVYIVTVRGQGFRFENPVG